MKISTNQFKNGTKLIIDNAPCSIIEHEFHKPGKGQAVMRVKYKNLLTGNTNDKTFKSGESAEAADVNHSEMEFLYHDNESWHFMDKVTFDQTLVDAARVELDKLIYKEQRAMAYPDWNTQLDYIYHHGIEKWKTDIIDPVKKKYPKPS